MSALPSFDGYSVLEKVRGGPIAEIYRAIQIPLERPVTIKSLGPGLIPSSPFAAGLEREARLLSQLSHPNVIALYDFVRSGDRMWLVLEQVEGSTLAEILKQARRLPQAGAAAIARSLASGLAHAHERGIVHRDLRPANVLVSLSGEVKLTDFAVASDERLPTAPELLDGSGGQPSNAYASPEQVLGEQPDPRSDLFSLGAVLFELITGEPPFGTDSDRSASVRIRNDPTPMLGRFVPNIVPSLERVVQRCLQKLPAHRFQSANELERALDAVLDELGADPRGALLGALSGAGFEVRGALPAAEETPVRRAPPSVFAAARVLILSLVLLLAGAFAIDLVARRAGRKDDERARQGRLELAPANPGYLRVVAEPWAHVIVDGQQLETTPFARPIPLAAGIHYVRLEHPYAATERRTIELAPGETILLDVTLKVRRPAGSLPVLPPSATPEPADSSP
ncbi:MAG TPA: serine/threonine-protein kinase [Polyangiaceae bacterium]